MNDSFGKLNELINGIGMMTELWMITYSSFKNQKLSDEDARLHTKAFMSVIIGEALNQDGKEKSDD